MGSKKDRRRARYLAYRRTRHSICTVERLNTVSKARIDAIDLYRSIIERALSCM